MGKRKKTIADKEQKKAERKKNSVGIGKMLLWQSSAVSVALSSLVFGFVTYYCTDTLGISAAVAGTMFMISKIFDSVTDVIAGFIVDRTETRWGKGRPYEAFMGLLWLCTWLLFSTPQSFSMTAKIIWVFIMYTFCNSVCQTFLNANNVVYMVRAFETKEQQVKVTAYGSFFTMGAALIFNILFPTAMAKIAVDASGWSRLIGMFALPLGVLGSLRMLTIKEQYNNDAKSETVKLTWKDIVSLIKGNPHILKIAAARFMQNMMTGLAGVSVYYWTYVIGNVGLMGISAVANVLVLPFAFLLPVLRRKWGLARLCINGMWVGVVGYVLTFFAGSSIPFFIAATTITALGAVPLNMLFNIFIVDCADYQEYANRPRMEGTMGSLLGLGSKIGNALGGFIMGLLMSASGYVKADVQTGSAIMMIRLLDSLIPAAVAILVILILRSYKLDKMLPEIKATLDLRKQAEAGVRSGGADPFKVLDEAEARAVDNMEKDVKDAVKAVPDTAVQDETGRNINARMQNRKDETKDE